MTANEKFHSNHRRWLVWSALAAAFVHGLLLVFFVAPRSSFEVRASEDFEVVDVPPEIKIPPPPEEIARPATPVIAETPEKVSEDITIAETEITENAPVPEAPPPAPPEAPPAEVGERYSFTPFTVRPKCRTNCTAENILSHVPSMLKRAGVNCKLVVGIRIDTSGNVTATDMLQSSSNAACDSAAIAWARTTSWTTAYNRDMAVEVWMAQPVTIETK